MSRRPWLPVAGNAAAALSSFLFSLVFLSRHSAEQYAVFSFVIVFGAALQTLVNAVFVHPFASKQALRYGLDRKNIGPVLLLFLLITTLLTCGSFQILTHDPVLSWLIALSLFALTLRFYLRACLIQQGEFTPAYSGDLAYLLLTLLTAGAAWFAGAVQWSYGLFFAGAVLSCGWYWRQLRFRWRLLRSMRFWLLNFRRFGWHSLQSALGAELLVTGISFVIIYGYGPAEYAPYALILLFLRPFTLVIASMNQTLKYKLSYEIGDVSSLRRQQRRYFAINLSALAGCIFLLMCFHSAGFAFMAALAENVLLLAGLFTVLMAVRIGRQWYTIRLQAYRQFSILQRAVAAPALGCILTMVSISLIGLPSTSVLISLILFETFVVYKLRSSGT
jgi:hypothetical protein